MLGVGGRGGTYCAKAPSRSEPSHGVNSPSLKITGNSERSLFDQGGVRQLQNLPLQSHRKHRPLDAREGEPGSHPVTVRWRKFRFVVSSVRRVASDEYHRYACLISYFDCRCQHLYEDFPGAVTGSGARSVDKPVVAAMAES